MTNFPKARENKIVVQESTGEILVYDLLNNKAHCLNETSSVVWRDCDGKSSVAEIAQRQQLPEEYVAVAVNELQKANLLAEKVDLQLPADRVSRRKMLLKVGATAVVLPLITSVVAPTAVHAQSGACLEFNATFELNPTPFFENIDLCVDALIAESETRCCSGGLNLQMGFEFGSDPQLCRGFCGGLVIG
jgi:hypothetical protein